MELGRNNDGALGEELGRRKRNVNFNQNTLYEGIKLLNN